MDQPSNRFDDPFDQLINPEQDRGFSKAFGYYLLGIRDLTLTSRQFAAVQDLYHHGDMARFDNIQEVLTHEIKHARGDAEADGTAAATGPLVVSWESLNEKKALFEKLVKTDIPANTKEISIAREHGDLRENFEFKAAKEKQAVLMRMKDDVELEIQRGQGTDFVDADISKVNIGTIVDFENVASGEKETVTILGAWDSVPEKNILSYLSDVAISMLGAKVGDVLDVRDLETEVNLKLKVEKIEAYAK